MPQHQERRPFSRIHFNAPAQLTIGSDTFEAEVLDLSLKGALFEWPASHSVQIDTPISVDIHLSDQIDIFMQGRVAHQESGRLGLECQSIDLESIQHLRRLIELNIGNSDAMERELCELIAPSQQP
ncbi:MULTISPECIES: PilZ domain-containing protein [Marinimicrobium]|jgi:hypothetical protein|uniref:Cyclic diguanosine monophosphate-binding protein n=1 Tax=Marinimicrobium koreense TaxID=306545 RepID=A0A3N1NTP9_9GAMM|nr:MULTISPECIES: PilZ domain-containing protein [Marinimicrobium]MAN52524.1 PilZ domain-containing protein [Marinimicrobium sp.]ROQ18558.1 PilZ domain-containing protein [Marinimicrobium koreense]|tara:strand:+ start:267 stop:644 length:378 start_codon:yes stop_codon:yes gene_type:complete